MKTCSKCGSSKPTGEFNADSSTIDGLRCYCRSCGASYWAGYREKNRETLNASQGVRRVANPEKARASVRKSELKMKYGLTPEFFSQMRKEQGDKCAICLDTFIKTPDIDHCHMTGKVRGLLCTNCNNGLGRFKDSVERLQRGIDYLQKAS